MVSETSRTAVTALAVAVGGAAGAALRYQLWRQWPTTNLEFPLTTLLINAFGCFVLGAAIGLPLNPDTPIRLGWRAGRNDEMPCRSGRIDLV